MSLYQIYQRLSALWQRQSLCRQFIILTGTIFITGMTVTGAWMASRIEVGVTQNTAASTALYFESVVAPLVQTLAKEKDISADKKQLLSRLISDTALGRRVVSFKIWGPGGLVLYATDADLIGKHFPPTSKLQQAWRGQVAASFDDLGDEENERERSGGQPLLEIYAPLRAQNSDRIIAVAEFYERAEQLKTDIFDAKREAWLIIAAIAVCAIAALFGLVGRASRTIERQIADLRRLLAQNEELRMRVEHSSQRVSEINERYLRELGSDLHDGPAQHIGLALLRLDALGRSPASIKSSKQQNGPAADIATIRTALRDALNEIRNISAGLVLPELNRLSVGETLEAAVRDHTRRTNTEVKADLPPLRGAAIHPIKTTAFRFVQEALNNATRHAGAAGQAVTAHDEGGFVVIEVSDKGGGFDPRALTENSKLGLAGMRERVESVGGELTINSRPGAGTHLKAKLPWHLGAA